MLFGHSRKDVCDVNMIDGMEAERNVYVRVFAGAMEWIVEI